MSHAQVQEFADSTHHEYLRTRSPIADWITITVTNNGTVYGCDVVLVFVKSPTPGEGGAPLKSLGGFERVCLQPGQSVAVPFSVTLHDFTLASTGGRRVAPAGTWTVDVGKPRQLTVEVIVA